VKVLVTNQLLYQLSYAGIYEERIAGFFLFSTAIVPVICALGHDLYRRYWSSSVDDTLGWPPIPFVGFTAIGRGDVAKSMSAMRRR
jgi:hypothetical protein